VILITIASRKLRYLSANGGSRTVNINVILVRQILPPLIDSRLSPDSYLFLFPLSFSLPRR